MFDVWVEFVMKLRWLLIRMTCDNSYKFKKYENFNSYLKKKTLHSVEI